MRRARYLLYNLWLAALVTLWVYDRHQVRRRVRFWKGRRG